jgi:hypothetical protein
MRCCAEVGNIEVNFQTADNRSPLPVVTGLETEHPPVEFASGIANGVVPVPDCCCWKDVWPQPLPPLMPM